jgi:hypothetical protein
MAQALKEAPEIVIATPVRETEDNNSRLTNDREDLWIYYPQMLPTYEDVRWLC